MKHVALLTRHKSVLQSAGVHEKSSLEGLPSEPSAPVPVRSSLLELTYAQVFFRKC